jgi:type III restriction enzyme
VTQNFFDRPILNSPYKFPGRHWELVDGRPTNKIVEKRRSSDFYSPVPQSRKRTRRSKGQETLLFTDEKGLSSAEQEYNPTPIINEIRSLVEQWRALPNPRDWNVTPETARLLNHWRHHEFAGIRPFFCQVEAVETAIWLAEVAPKLAAGAKFMEHLRAANGAANPELMRTALKLATGAGKTTVMAMLIAWQTINAKRHPNSRTFSRGFLVVAPGLTIKDRLRVLLPNDLDSYYKSREIVPADMLGDLDHAKVVITNYHAFRLRERLELAKGTREAIEGWRGDKIETLETEGQMIQRVMPELMGMKNIVVLNDEAHHCYRERIKADDGEEELKGDEKEEAKENNEAARMWISGLEAVKRKLGISMVYDLSATPFFLRGSGYREGTLFPWTVSDFSLMDAIECGIVKLPRVPVADNVVGGDAPMFRNLWDHIGKKMPKRARSSGSDTAALQSLPNVLLSAIDALYGHYKKTFEEWEREGMGVPPVFIFVCNNTTTSELIYKYVSGYAQTYEDGTEETFNGRLPLFDNFDSFRNRRSKPNTILIDSAQLEAGDALDKDFRDAAAAEIAQFKREIVERTGDREAAEKISDAELLREVMNTVGKKGRLGEQVRCVVSVSMLTEGWDANTVTHILGVRAFGTQLLCEQVVGRGLRRASYELNEDGLFNVEYADIFGIPFDFAADPVQPTPSKPRETIHVHAVRPDRDALEITFPRVEGYRLELPEERVDVKFNEDSVLHLTAELVGPTIAEIKGIIGEGVTMTLEHLKDMRLSTVFYHLAWHLLTTKFRDASDEPKIMLFNHLKSVVRQWYDGGYLRCQDGTYPAQLIYRELADLAASRIAAAITLSQIGEKPVKAMVSAFNPTGSTAQVSFNTSKTLRWDASLTKSHVNWIICDSSWETEFCRVVESDARVLCYAKNQGLGLEVPYVLGSVPRRYFPDFIVKVDDGQPDPLNIIVEVKGFRGEDAKEKANTMRAYWVPGVNNLKRFGRWEFIELRSGMSITDDFKTALDKLCGASAPANA